MAEQKRRQQAKAAKGASAAKAKKPGATERAKGAQGQEKSKSQEKLKMPEAAPVVAGAELVQRVLEAAMELAAAGQWRNLSLAEIAEAAGLPLRDVYVLFSSRQAIFNAFSREIDLRLLADCQVEQGASPRDRLFETVMYRFDLLRPYRAALKTIWLATLRDPIQALSAARQLRQSMAAVLQAAEIDSEGLGGVAKIKGLSAIYISVFRRFLEDESADLAPTMALLDTHLNRAAGWFSGLQKCKNLSARVEQAFQRRGGMVKGA